MCNNCITHTDFFVTNACYFSNIFPSFFLYTYVIYFVPILNYLISVYTFIDNILFKLWQWISFSLFYDFILLSFFKLDLFRASALY
jgi:hypothetical protein